MAVQVPVKKPLQRGVLLLDGRRHADQRSGRRADVFDRRYACLVQPPLRFLDEVVDDRADHAPDDFVNETPILEVRITVAHPAVLRIEQPLFAQLVEGQQPRSIAVIDIVVVVGDGVADIRDLRFEAGLPAQQESFPDVPEAACIALRAVLENALARLEHEIQSRKVGVFRFELVDDTQ